MAVLKSVALPDRPGVFDIAMAGGMVRGVTPAETQGVPRWLAMPALCNEHAHANRAFSAAGARPASLAEAVQAAKAHRATDTVDAVRQRAGRFFAESVRHGVARVRTHTDIDPITGMRAIDGVLAAAREHASAIDVEVVAFATAAADVTREDTRALFEAAVARGAGLIGGVPALSASPERALEALMRTASELRVGLDLHLDEHLDGAKSLIERTVDLTSRLELHGRVRLSHACSLSCLDERALGEVLRAMALAGISLVALPELNLYLQDREATTPRLRGIAPVVAAMQAGVEVRFGTDNVRDWFFPYGDCDMLTAAYVGAIACHVGAAGDLLRLVCGGRSSIGEAQPADILVLRASSIDEALATRPADRILLKAGVPVSGTAPADLLSRMSS